MGNPDDLSDVTYSEQGIFGTGFGGTDSALDENERVRHKLVREGVEYTFRCPGCGMTTKLTLEWPELVALKFGLNPALVFQHNRGFVDKPMSWSPDKDERAWKPDARCEKCNYYYGLRISPDEPERRLKAARRARLINPNGERAVTQLCQQMARGG